MDSNTIATRGLVILANRKRRMTIWSICLLSLGVLFKKKGISIGYFNIWNVTITRCHARVATIGDHSRQQYSTVCTTRNSATTPFYRTYAQHAHDPQFAIVLRELSVIPCEWLPAIIADVELWALTFRLSINISYSSLHRYSTRQQICSFELGGDMQ